MTLRRLRLVFGRIGFGDVGRLNNGFGVIVVVILGGAEVGEGG